jgi:tetratricopeptide (TPR) repeat protein
LALQRATVLCRPETAQSLRSQLDDKLLAVSASQQLLDGVARRREAASLQQRGRPDEAIIKLREAAGIYAALDPAETSEAHAEALDALAGLLRSQGRASEALEPAEQALLVVTKLAHEDAPRYLALLARLTENLGRCCQQLRQFDRAAAAYEQAVGGFAILAELGAERDRLALAEVMSRHALALAQIGQLEQAYLVAGRFVGIGRELLPGSLPLLVGGLQFLADLAGDLERPAERVAHLVDAVRVLERAVEQGLPGANEAASRMAAALREASVATGVPVPAGLLERLS